MFRLSHRHLRPTRRDGMGGKQVGVALKPESPGMAPQSPERIELAPGNAASSAARASVAAVPSPSKDGPPLSRLTDPGADLSQAGFSTALRGLPRHADDNSGNDGDSGGSNESFFGLSCRSYLHVSMG